MISSSEPEQGTVDMSGDGDCDRSWLGHSFSTSELPPTLVSLKFYDGDADEIRTGNVVLLRKCEGSPKAVYDISPINDELILYSVLIS